MSPLSDPRIARWDQRYARGEELFDFRPNPLLPEAAGHLPPGRALDLACGGGRHALWLAERGFVVDAVDASRVALDLLAREAERRGVRACISTHCADLEAEPPGFVIPDAAYDLILVTHFLHRPLLRSVAAGLRPSGRLVAAIHVALPGREAPHAFLLQPGELRAIVEAQGLTVVHAYEGDAREHGHRHAIAEVVAERPGA
ncbi:MAG TPA: methyltransferase domain-containing protein [Planctomycetota bacterium]|nr:methyltransferase domain-containing protein [Planctomycetota bacterium]